MKRQAEARAVAAGGDRIAGLDAARAAFYARTGFLESTADPRQPAQAVVA